MSPCVIKVENAWLRFIQVVSVNSSVKGRITLTTNISRMDTTTFLSHGATL